MRYLDTTTAIGGLEGFGFENGSYPIRVQQFESVSEALAVIGKCSEEDVAVEAPEGALSAILGVVNAAQEQNGKQGGKEKIRKAMAEGDADAVQTEVADQQARSEKYLIGAPRGGGQGGLTKTRAGNFGKALKDVMPLEEMKALAAKHGLDVDELFG